MLLQQLNVDPKTGLTEKEVIRRQKEVGPNRLTEGKKVSLFLLFLNQFQDFMVLVLLGATLISGLLGEYTDAIAIIAIVVINAVLGFVQEYRAEKSLHALKELTAPTAKVNRDGEEQVVPAVDLVPGDIILLESGDRVPADAKLFKANGLYVEESALTGESVPAGKQTNPIPHKDVPLGDQTNLLFMGTSITRGTAVAVVIETGMNTEMGKIANLIDSTESMDTPLQRRLEQLGKILIVVALLLTVVVVVTGIWHGQDAYGMFLTGVSLAVAAIPEGLPAIVTIALALGVQRMIKRKAIVRKLPSVETLGCASVICSDKTGTLTQNKMTVTYIWTGGKSFEVTGTGYDPAGTFRRENQEIDPRRDSDLLKILEIGTVCNNAKIRKEQDKKGLMKRTQTFWSIQGDPTEASLIVAAAKAGIWKEELSQNMQRITEFPFDSIRKMMSIVVQSNQSQYVYVKGAPDVLLDRCNSILWEGREVALTEERKKQVLLMNEERASKALRNLAIAYRGVGSGEKVDQENTAERNLVFIGLMSMIDPPREEVKEAIATCRSAGIKTVMITGDHQTTAFAIANELEIIPAGGKMISGQQLSQMDAKLFEEEVDNIYVYARVSPEHKLRIVKALQAQGHVVAMTGDGVNDAPAIKAADIGISMGITGTDVTKEASSLVLSDDNFATIVAAIEEGRGIYDNIRKFIRYLLASNVGEILVMFFAMLMGLPLPLVPIQILWVNLVTDGLPAMALGVDQAEEDMMRRKPRNPRESIFARGLGWKIISRGFLIGICTLAAFYYVYTQNPSSEMQLVKAQTIAFCTLVMAQLIHVFDCRSDYSVYHRNPFQNVYLVIAVLSSILLLFGVIYIDWFQPIFHTMTLNMNDWIIILIAAAIPTFIAGLRYFPLWYKRA